LTSLKTKFSKKT